MVEVEWGGVQAVYPIWVWLLALILMSVSWHGGVRCFTILFE